MLRSGLEPVYIATAEARDEEMRARIRRHRARRGGAWPTIEVPLELPEAVAAQAGPDRAVLVDCLTLWLTNLLLADRDVAEHRARLCAALPRCSGPVVLVSNEAGLGIVPMGELSRRFIDEAGGLHQELAAAADQVRLLVAGLPLDLKPRP